MNYILNSSNEIIKYELIKFLKNNKFGFLNNRASIKVEAKYEDLASFSEGLASFKLDSKWGFYKQRWLYLINIQV